MSLLKFEPTDFEPCQGYSYEAANERAAYICNKKFNDWLEKAIPMNGTIDKDGDYSFGSWKDKRIDTHTALLVNVEQINKECDHSILQYTSKNPHPVMIVDCATCGAKLKAKWEVVE